MKVSGKQPAAIWAQFLGDTCIFLTCLRAKVKVSTYRDLLLTVLVKGTLRAQCVTTNSIGNNSTLAYNDLYLGSKGPVKT